MGDNFGLPLDKTQPENEWILEWLTSKQYHIAALSIIACQLIVMPILCILHIHRLLKGTDATKMDKSNPLRIKYIIIDNMGLLSIIFSFLSALITISNYATIFDTSTCKALTIIQNTFWLFTKASIYLVILLRLQAAFWDSAYEINHVVRNVCYFCIISFCIILTVGTALPNPIGVDSMPISNVNGVDTIGGLDFCMLIIPAWLILTPMMFDIMSTTMSLYLFIKPVRSIIKKSRKSTDTRDMSKLLTKYTLISSIAILSNLLSSIFFAITDILIFTYLDIFLNPICLMLMQKHHENIYMCLCKCCHKGMSKIFTDSEPSTTLSRAEDMIRDMQRNGNADSKGGLDTTTAPVKVDSTSVTEMQIRYSNGNTDSNHVRNQDTETELVLGDDDQDSNSIDKKDTDDHEEEIEGLYVLFL